MMDSPIFIHSLFRTGSTYLWSKFRETGDYCCFYEPFHNELLGLQQSFLDNRDDSVFDYLKHPPQDRPYFYEYKDVIKDIGVENFKECFVAEEFCFNGDNPALKTYINTLIESAGDKRPVLQFNRSALRTEWFSREFPSAVNIYLFRNVRDNFESFVRYMSLDNNYFLTMNLVYLTYSVNQPVFSWLKPYFSEWLMYEGSIEERIQHFNSIGSEISLEFHYLLFYTIWYLALIFNGINATVLLDINQLSTEESYRKILNIKLQTYDITLNFDDCSITVPDKYSLSTTTYTFIEALVNVKLNQYIEDQMYG